MYVIAHMVCDVQVNLGSTSDAVESVANVTDIHEAMFFHADDEVTRTSFGIWSLRWSPDGKEIIAGTGDSSLYIYDVESQRVWPLKICLIKLMLHPKCMARLQSSLNNLDQTTCQMLCIAICSISIQEAAKVTLTCSGVSILMSLNVYLHMMTSAVLPLTIATAKTMAMPAACQTGTKQSFN